MLVFLGVNWVVMDGNGDNMRLDDDWIWDFDGNVDWERHLDFLDDWNFDLLVDWVLFDVMMMDGVHVVRHRNLDVFAGKRKTFSLPFVSNFTIA